MAPKQLKQVLKVEFLHFKPKCYKELDRIQGLRQKSNVRSLTLG